MSPREPVSGQPSVPINTLLTPEDKQALDRQARLEERSAAAIIRRALRDYCESWEPARGKVS